MMKAWFLGLGLALLSPPAFGDVFLLANGNRIEGITLSETTDKIEVQFAYSGSVTFSRSEISAVVPSDDAARQALRERWKKAQETFQEDFRRQEEFKTSQRANGLILDGAEWLTQVEYRERTERERVALESQKIESDRQLKEAVIQNARQAEESKTASPSIPVPSSTIIVVHGRPGFVHHPRPGKPREESAGSAMLPARRNSLYFDAMTRIYNFLNSSPPALGRY